MTIETPGSRSCLGLDLGQARDYSAIAIPERRVELTGTRDPVTFVQHTRTRVLISHLERIPLRTPYLDVVARVRAIVQQFQPGKLQVVMDATGGGAAVRDMLARANLGVPLIAVTLTGGERVNVSHGAYHVPRQDLLANLRVLLEKRMLAIEVKGDAAVALACWKAGGQPFALYGPGPPPTHLPGVAPMSLPPRWAMRASCYCYYAAANTFNSAVSEVRVACALPSGCL